MGGVNPGSSYGEGTRSYPICKPSYECWIPRIPCYAGTFRRGPRVGGCCVGRGHAGQRDRLPIHHRVGQNTSSALSS